MSRQQRVIGRMLQIEADYKAALTRAASRKKTSAFRLLDKQAELEPVIHDTVLVIPGNVTCSCA